MSKKEGKKEVKFKALMSREQLADYLESLVSGLRQGRLAIDTEKGSLTLKPGENMSVKVEAAEKKDKCKLEMEWSWPRELPGDNRGEAAPEGEGLAEDSGEEGDQSGDEGDGQDEEGGDDQDESGDEPLKKSYKKIKKSLQKGVKDLKAALDRGEMPALELTEALVRDCEALTAMPGKGDERYPEFSGQVAVLAEAARSGDRPGLSTAVETLLEMKKECHSQYK